MAKRDKRPDNLGKIAKNIGDTLKNMDASSDYIREHRNELSEEDKRQIREKNQRRNRAVKNLHDEINDKTAYSKTR